MFNLNAVLPSAVASTVRCASKLLTFFTALCQKMKWKTTTGSTKSMVFCSAQGQLVLVMHESRNCSTTTYWGAQTCFKLFANSQCRIVSPAAVAHHTSGTVSEAL